MWHLKIPFFYQNDSNIINNVYVHKYIIGHDFSIFIDDVTIDNVA
jgi:hypothetical protein